MKRPPTPTGGGTNINIGSVAGIRPRPGLTWYNGSNGAVNILSQSMAVELAPSGIRVNCICPVLGGTDLLESFMGHGGHAGKPQPVLSDDTDGPAVAPHRHRQCPYRAPNP